MENETKVTTGVIVTLLALIGTFTYIGQDERVSANYYCLSSESVMYCDHLSSTEVTCYPTEERSGYKRCSEGWKEIPEETPKATGNRYSCNKEGCKITI